MMYYWTEEESARLRQMYVDGKRRRTIAAELGMTEQAVKGRIALLRLSKEEKALRRVNRRKYENAEEIQKTRAWKEQPCVLSRPSPQLLAERDMRLKIKPRDLTAEFCGDPLPGFSALDLKLAGARA